MDAKLNHSDLSALLAKEAGMSLAKADLFTKTFFDLVIEGLEQDGVVKINGLGTFKLTDVASRSSVNVNTGEKFEIKGHRKLVFTPADSLKDCVNQPFAMFEPVEVDETYSDDDDESNDALADENAAVDDVQADIKENVETNEEDAIEEEPVAPQVVANVVEEATEKAAEIEMAEEDVIEQEEEQQEEEAELQAEKPAEELTEPVVEPAEEPLVEQPKRPEPVMVHVPKKEKKPFAVPEKKEKKNRTWLYVVFAVLFVLSAMAVLFMLYITPVETDNVRIDTVTRIEYKTDDATGETVAVETVTEKVTTTDAVTGVTVVEESVTKTEHKTDGVTGATVDATTGATPQDKELVSNEESVDALVQEQVEPAEYKFVIIEELASLDLKNITLADTALYDIDGVWAEHKVVAHETLTRIALKYYGDKKLWPYIVKFNSLARPDDLSKGMKILIPKLKPRN